MPEFFPGDIPVKRRCPLPPLPSDLRHEQIATVDAVLKGDLRSKSSLGVFWSHYHEVRLFLGAGHMIEMVRPFGGRAPGCRIRVWNWADVISAEIRGRHFVVRVRSGKQESWYIPDAQQTLKLKGALAEIFPKKHGSAPSLSGSPVLHCPYCWNRLTDTPEGCPDCGALFVTPKSAGRLAAVLPGGGHLATGHRLVGSVRMLTELLFVLYWGIQVGESGILAHYPLVALMPVGFFLLALKLEAILTARYFARFLVPWSSRVRHAWTIAGTFGAVISVAVIFFLLYLVPINGILLRDLEFHGAAGSGWKARYEPVPEGPLSRVALRSTWTRNNGQRISVFAQTLGPWLSPDTWIRQERARRIELGLNPGTDVSTTVLDAFSFLTPVGLENDTLRRLEITVLDHRHHTIHTMSCVLPASEVETMRKSMLELLRTGHWIWSADPCNSDWSPDKDTPQNRSRTQNRTDT